MTKRKIATPQVAMQAPESDTAAPAAKRTRVERSDRVYIDSNGGTGDEKNPVTIENAAGIRYIVLGTDGGDKAVDYVYGQDAELDKRMCLFGVPTKLGNVGNTVWNDKDEPGDADDGYNAIVAWLGKAKGVDGVWAERTGGGGAAIDRETLADAIIANAIAKGDLDAANAVPARAKVRARMDAESDYIKGVKSVPEVMREYATRKGKASKSVADLL